MKGFKTTRRCVRHRAFVVRALSSGEKSFIIAIRTLKTRNSGCHVNNLLPEMLMQAPAPFRALSFWYFLCLCLLPFDFDSAAFFLDNFSTRTFILPSVIREHFFFRLSDVSYLFVAGKNGQLMLWNSGGACSWFLRLETDNSVAISPSSIISSEQLPSRMISFD